VKRWTVRIEGTISDEVEVEAETEEEAREKARLAWRYTEYVDLWASDVDEEDD
jgi:hypothetical protein